MTFIDYAALAERIKQAVDNQFFGEASVTLVSKDDLRTVVSLLRGMADEAVEPVVHIMPSDLKRLRKSETSAAVYSVPFSSPEERSVPLFKHPAPHPIDPHMLAAEDRYPSEPTEAQIEAGARALNDVVCEHFEESWRQDILELAAEFVLRAALAAKDTQEQPK